MKLKVLPFILSIIMAFMSLSFNQVAFAEEKVTLTSYGPWCECAYFVWNPVASATGYNVYYKLTTEGEYKKADSELISGTRCDLVGLMGDREYDVKIVPVIGGSDNEQMSTSVNVTPYAPDEVGYAFKEDAWTTGGYNKDGSIPENAQIVYVSQSNQGNFSQILSAKQSGDKTPLIVRVIGEITSLGKLNGKVLTMHQLTNTTFEGVGPNAGFTSMGLNPSSNSENVEIKNLYFKNYGDDGVSICREAKRIYVHHCEFGYGYDGACDVKLQSTDITIAQNYCNGAGKAMLCGHSNSETADKGKLTVTYYNNYYKETDQRCPRIRFGKVHVLNNYYDSGLTYAVGAACECHALVEGNYFYNQPRPTIVSQQGNAFDPNFNESKGNLLTKSSAGYLKTLNNYVDPTCTFWDESIDTKVDGFDFDPHQIYKYKALNSDTAKDYALKYAGTVQRAGNVLDGSAAPVPSQTAYDKDAVVVTTESTTEATTQAPVDENGNPIENYYILDASKVLTVAQNATAGTDDYFTFTATGTSMTADEEYNGVKLKGYIKFGSTNKGLSFTTKDKAVIRIFYGSGKASFSGDGVNETLDATNETVKFYECKTSTAGTYTLKTASNANLKIYRIEVYEGGKTPAQTTTKETTTQITTQTTTTQTTTEKTTQATTNTQNNKGDVNKDGSLTASDAANVLAFVLNTDSFALDKDVADADSNGQITASDAATILAKVLNNDFVL